MDVSLVIPLHDEEDNIRPLYDEIVEVLSPHPWEYEIIFVNDRSRDSTPQKVEALMAEDPRVVQVHITTTGHGPRGLGPSGALRAGILHVRGRITAILDGDRQNDPHDLPEMIQRVDADEVDMIQGDRSHARRDNLKRRVSSTVGRKFRSAFLGDGVRDSACALRVMKSEVAKAVPLQFKGIHRFFAFQAAMMGYRIDEVRVNHRPRVAGEAKFGIWNRALPGLIDLIAVRWMTARFRNIQTRVDRRA